MDSLLAAAIAILGTLAGSVVNHLLQGRSTARAEVFARDERLRAQRLGTYGEFAKVIMDYRRAEFARWECADRQSPEPARQEAKAESHRLRGAAWHALFQVDFLSDDPQLMDVATGLVDATGDLHNAADGDELRARGVRIREELRRFIELGSVQVR